MINAIQILIMPVCINTSDALLAERHEQDMQEAQMTLQAAMQAGYIVENALPFVLGDSAFVWMLLVQKGLTPMRTLGEFSTQRGKFENAKADAVIEAVSRNAITPPPDSAILNPRYDEDEDFRVTHGRISTTSAIVSEILNTGSHDFLITGD